jgi:hypothetical protein
MIGRRLHVFPGLGDPRFRPEILLIGRIASTVIAGTNWWKDDGLNL